MNGRVATEGTDICNLFGEFFQSNYTSNIVDFDDTMSADCRLPGVILSFFTITYTDICTSIQSLKLDGSKGPDGIPSVFMRNCCNNLLKPLHIIFNKCISFGFFPSKWKVSNIIPIHKSGPKSEVGNYRPISINNNFAKVFDHILAQVLKSHIKDHLIDEQHGFMTGRSTESNLFIFANFVNNSVENGSSVDCIYTDIRKAFDRVPIEVLLNKLESYFKIYDPLLSCLRSFLLNRSQKVSINGYSSLPILATSGVGQGTHLGPILFLAFINDLKLTIGHSEFLLFADDCKIYKRVDNKDDCASLQSDLNAFVKWCNVNGLELNIAKCKYVQFTRKVAPLQVQYYIDGNLVEKVAFIKDLGVFFDSKLSYIMHIDNIVARANKLLGFINRSTRSFSNIRCIIILFTALTRPILEYCSVIWAPSYKIHIHRLENIQKKFIRSLCYKAGIDYYKHNYDYLITYFSLPTLASRRCYADIMFLFKVLNGIIDCSYIQNHFTLSVPSRPLRTCPLLSVDFHRTNYGIHSSSTRISSLVNSLNLDYNSFERTASSFRSLLRQRLYN